MKPRLVLRTYLPQMAQKLVALGRFELPTFGLGTGFKTHDYAYLQADRDAYSASVQHTYDVLRTHIRTENA